MFDIMRKKLYVGRYIKVDRETTKNFKCIKEYIDENGFSPTVREVAKMIGLKSTSTVNGYLEILEKEGYIEKYKKIPRRIKIVKS